MRAFVIEGLVKEYGGRRVLDIPALTVEEGRIYALVGPNGAGKTTLLSILAFLERPTRGSLRYRGNVVRDGRSERLSLRREVVLVDQQPVLFTDTVRRNVEFGLRARGVPLSEREGRVDEALDLVGMGGFADARAHRLSGGEGQRVALARAIVLRPRVLLCDEPTASVDRENQSLIAEVLRRLNAEGTTILFTTHDGAQAAELAQCTICLEGGKLVEGEGENLFFTRFRGGGEGELLCRLQGGPLLQAGGNGTCRAGEGRVFVDPERIELTCDGAAGGEGGALRGRVRRLAQEGDRVSVVVDAGLHFCVSMTAEDYRREAPLVGDRVTLRIPPRAVRPVPPPSEVP